jgi:hypothetical protein
MCLHDWTGSRRQFALFNDVTTSSPSFQDHIAKLDETGRKPDVQFFDLSTIIAATDNFSPAKRLGQGGFGPVYKVSLVFFFFSSVIRDMIMISISELSTYIKCNVLFV